MIRLFVAWVALLAFSGLFFAGCASGPARVAGQQEGATQQWFLDPSVSMASYKTYGMLQATAVRYQDPMPERKSGLKPGFFNEIKYYMFGRDKEAKRLPVNHTDELIWRVLAEEMAAKGYAQVAPQDADILIAYYGGPRPQTSTEALKVKTGTFDTYWAQNELREETFFVDVIDNKTAQLVYRGWDQDTFTKDRMDRIEPDKIVKAAQETIGFFPSRR